MGLGFVGGELFVMDDTQGDIDVYDAQTGAYLRSVPAPSSSLTGFSGDDANNLLYGVDQATHTLLRIDPATGSVLDSAPSGLGSEQGMGVLGDELFVSETGGLGDPLQDIVVYDAATFTEVRRFAMPFGTMIAGLGADGVPASFSPAGTAGSPLDQGAEAAGGGADLYELSLVAGDTVLITTQVLGGSLSDLDPAVALFDPSDTLVASDSDTEDGRNARVVYTAADAGTHKIQVLADDGGGEYLLRAEVFHESLPWITIDDVEIVVSTPDCNGTGTPDECESFGDFDLSGRVDLRDFARFQACFTGEGPAERDPGCCFFDAEQDLDVDLEDFAAFLTTFLAP